MSAPAFSGCPVRQSRPRRALRVIVEAASIALIGAILALVANALSPRGLALTTNYFPGGTNGLVAPLPALVSSNAATNALSTTQDPAAPHINDKGLQMIGFKAAVRLFLDPRTQKDLVIFVDARNEDDFNLGHIPGAREFDPYHPEKKAVAVMALCNAAEQIVVYCTGGDCEDSQSAAILLRDAGTPNSKLMVYEGGFTEWTTNNMPVEKGEPKAKPDGGKTP